MGTSAAQFTVVRTALVTGYLPGGVPGAGGQLSGGQPDRGGCLLMLAGREPVTEDLHGFVELACFVVQPFRGVIRNKMHTLSVPRTYDVTWRLAASRTLITAIPAPPGTGRFPPLGGLQLPVQPPTPGR